jgi:hypothetical protein
MEWPERATGAVVGPAVGDAVGARLEFSVRADARTRCAGGDNVAVGVATAGASAGGRIGERQHHGKNSEPRR